MKLDMVERSLNGYKELCAAQETELKASKSLPDLGMSSSISESYERFKKDMEVLRQENERLRRRKEELELMVEQLSLKGAYNLDNKFKVVHMSMNPNAEAQETYQNEVEKLQAEVSVHLNEVLEFANLIGGFRTNGYVVRTRSFSRTMKRWRASTKQWTLRKI